MRLGARFILLVSAILALTLGLTSLYLIQLQRQLAREQLLETGRAQGELLALIAPDAIAGYNFILLNEYVQQVTRHPDVVFAAVFDLQGRPMTSFLDSANPLLRSARAAQTDAGMNDVVRRLASNPRMLVERLPIGRAGNPLGELVIAFDTRRIERELGAIVARQATAYGLIIVLLSAAIYAVFRFKVLRPVNALVRGAKRVSEGEYERPVERYADDELGALTTAFNAMMDEIRGERKQLSFQANYDALTGLPNRKLALERIDHEIRRSLREGTGFAIMFVDLDNFKSVNDTMGHTVGDKLLIQTGKRFKNAIRSIDMLARLGGDEYLVVMPNCDSVAVAQSAAERLVDAIRPPARIQGADVYTMCSIGVAFFPDDGDNAEALMAVADRAMYSAKADPVSKVHFAPGR